MRAIAVILPYFQIIISVFLIAAILIQQRGAGMGGAFGGGGAAYHTKRGFEKILFYATIVLSVIFFGIAILNMYYAI